MKRLQLFGRGKVDPRESYRPLPSTSKSSAKSNASHRVNNGLKQNENSGLFQLPSKVLDQILDLLDTQTLLSLCLVHSKLYNIISNKFLYERVVLKDKVALLKFAALIHCESHTVDALMREREGSLSQNLRFLVRSLEFVNPYYQDSLLKYSKFCGKDQSTTIGGSYKISNSSTIKDIQSLARGRSGESSNHTGSSGVSRERSQSSESKSWQNTNRSPSSLKEKTYTPLGSFFDSSSTSSISRMIEKYENHTYIELMLDIIDFCPNVTSIILSDIQHGFKVPLWYSVLNDGSKDFFKRIIKGQQSMNRDDIMSFQLSSYWISDYEEKYHTFPRFKKLELKGCNDKPPVILRSNMLSCFGVFEELSLKNMAIDAESLDTPFEYVPFYMKIGVKGLLDLHLPVTTLSIDRCEIIPGNGIMKLMCSYFHRVKNLKLLSLKSKYDLILTRCFPNLAHVTIDCNSDCFKYERVVGDAYYHQEADCELPDDRSVTETLVDFTVAQELIIPPATTPIVLAMNGGYIKRSSGVGGRKPGIISELQEQYFTNMRVPPFHYFYHYYKSIWDRIPNRNVSIKIVNIPFTNVFPLPPDIYWRQLESYADDDSQTLCGNSRNLEGGNESQWWNERIAQCINDATAATPYEEDDRQNRVNGHHLWNNYQNAHIFKDIPNVNVWLFLKSLSNFKSVEIEMLKKWLFCTPRTRYDWELLLKPILNGRVPVTVRDHDGFVLYKYGTT
ncbi:LAQU0S23e00936g1_1 [Lachancea quebecensis]|uniref:LAQU0S23e00936g1_1 n=1 Tax=Lachancea quebecensis TaxID=1654605 RepID=A0A0P1KYD8_9SACH|nr:LAQU0S23e00936g1_1 [Lachancea quebecensis]